MKMELSYDEQIDAWTLRHDAVEIDSNEALERWHDLLERELATAPVEAFHLMICVEGFSLAPELAEAYGQIAKHMVLPRTRAVVRYGTDNGLTTTSIRLGAVLNRYPANIFPDRRHASEALLRIRRLGGSCPG
ncbi:MAG: hypothetical protein K0V04_12205 [Deltaproteobacteria bacterium]|nr:hypothetical protein [Deltaproteobacteria bacterium]